MAAAGGDGAGPGTSRFGRPAPAGRGTRRPVWLRRALRSLYLPAGWGLIVLGILIGPLPGPGGIPVVAAGVVILLRHSPWARRRFVGLRRRYPKMLAPVENFLRRKKRNARNRPADPPPGPGPGRGNGS